jgi:hypothetical protein
MSARPAVEVSERAATRTRHGPIDWMGGWRLCVWGSLAVVALAALQWSYISRYAWTVAIDAASQACLDRRLLGFRQLIHRDALYLTFHHIYTGMTVLLSDLPPSDAKSTMSKRRVLGRLARQYLA